MKYESMKELSIDKSGWTPVKFGDVVFEPKESVKDIIKAGIKHVVGLEHIDSEDIHLRRSAGIEDETTFTKKFSSGDVLFGRRRAYLKKAARAEFDGICSGDIIVMRAKQEQLIPELLPFIVNNDSFFDFAIEHSAGGLSPRVKFKDLANYEFLLPSKTQQTRLVKLLWAMDESIEADFAMLETLKIGFKAKIEKSLHGIELDGKTIKGALAELAGKQRVSKLGELGVILKGKGVAKSEAVKEGIACVRYGELYTRHHRIIRNFHTFISNESASYAVKLKKNDVLFAGSGETIEEIGKSAAFVEDIEAYAGSDILIFRPHDMDGIYLGYLMNSELVRHQLNKMGTGATVMHVYASDLKNILIPKHDRQKQENIGNQLESVFNSILLLQQKINRSRALQKNLTNQVF